MEAEIDRSEQFVRKLLTWITDVARNPSDPLVVSSPEFSNWPSYEKLRKKVLLVREKRFSDGRVYSSLVQSISQTIPGLDVPTSLAIPRGTNFQAYIPEWTSMSSESDLKWIGTRIWPLENEDTNLNTESEDIGKGREESCECQEPNSKDCVRFHIASRKMKLKDELGNAFSHWQFDQMGEEFARSWSESDKRKLKYIAESKKDFWDVIVRTFSRKKEKDLVNYLFNVILLQKRADQNRSTPEEIFTDDEQREPDEEDDEDDDKGSAKNFIRSLYVPKKQRLE